MHKESSLRSVRQAWLAPTLALLLLPIGGCNSEESADTGAQELGSPWTITKTTDPMTDQTIHSANSKIEGDTIDIDAVISCDDKRITYTLLSFEKDGAPAPLPGGYGLARVMVRVDQAKAYGLATPFKPSNRFEVFEQEPALALASKLTFRFNRAEGPGTFVIDQSNTSLRRMLDECVKAIGGQAPSASGGRQSASQKQPEDPDLARYDGQYPFDKVGTSSFLEDSVVREAVARSVDWPEIRQRVLDPNVTTAPIETDSSEVLYWGCEPHNCSSRNWTVVIHRASNKASVCYFDIDEASPISWWTDDERWAKFEREGCPKSLSDKS